MLELTIKGSETFDSETQVFGKTEDVVLKLEHSLVSLSIWESKWEKPFLSREEKTTEEVYGYIQAMSLEGEIPKEVLARLSSENVSDLNKYIEAKMTATWFNTAAAPRSGPASVITAEVIYHWMTALQIPYECQYWHLNRLITLVKVINEKNAEASNGKKKQNPTRSSLDARRELNAARRAKMETSG